MAWEPRQRNYAAEVQSAASVPAAKHPLEDAALKLAVAEKKEADAQQKGVGEAAQVVADPLQGNAVDDPLGAALVDSDPLSDPLGAVGSDSAGPTTGGPVLVASGTNVVDMDPGVARSTSWRERRTLILKQYAAVGQLRVSSDLLEADGVAASKLGSNIDEGGPSGEKKVAILDTKTRGRLETLEAAAAAEEGRTVKLTQTELVARVDRLNADLRAAWKAEERVRALKIAIQVSKMLGDTSFPTFFPTVFAVVAEILDSFGELVYERVMAKGTPAGKKLPPGYTPDEVAEEGKETTKNWFYKVASIRELVPRFYVELSILRCYRLLRPSSELPAVVERLSAMTRGFGDPLAATYARSYLVHKAIDLTPTHAHALVRAPVLETITVFEKQLAFTADPKGGAPTVRGLHNVKVEITTAEYFGTFAPALEWLLQSLTEHHPTQETFVMLVKKYREQCKAAIFLNAIIGAFEPTIISSNALPVCDLIREADARGYSRHHLYVTLGRVLCASPPPKEDLLSVLNDVWSELGGCKSARQYVDVAVQYLQLLLAHFGVPEVTKLLKDLLKRVSADKAYTELYPQLQRGVVAVLECAPRETLGALFVLEPFQRLLALFDREHARINWKRIMETFAAAPGPFTDPALINNLTHVARELHDSVDFLSFQDERRQLALLIAAFIQKVSFGPDFEAHLAFYVECRAAFVNLDAVQDTLVLGVATLLMRTRSLVHGRHSKKTAAFAKACAAYMFITIPTIESSMLRLKLHMLGAQVALANQLLPQMDAFVKAAVTMVPEVLSEDSDAAESSAATLRDACAKEELLVSALSSACAFLVAVPGHPRHGPFYLVTGLLNVIQKGKWRLPASQPTLYLRILALFSTYAQRVIPYRVPGVDSNDVLYASEPEYVEKLQEMIGLILVGLETALGELGGKSDAPSGRALAACAISWCELAVGVTSLSPPLVALTSKLYGLASKSKFADKAALVNFGRHVAHLSKQRGGGHAELHTRLSALASK